MFQNDPHQSGDGDGENSLIAGLLITSTIATRTAAGKYSRLWRRSTLCISFAISLRRGSIGEEPTSPDQSSHIVIDVRSDKGEEEIHEEEILPHNLIVQDQDAVRNIVKERDLNSLRKLGGVDRAVTLLGSDMQDGIDGSEVQQVWSTTNNVPIDEKGFWHFFRDACFTYQIVLLFISALLAFAIDIKEHGPKYGWHDGVAILVAAVLVVALFSVGKFCQERKRKKTLLENMNKRDVKVVRSGELKNTTVSDVVVGDIVVLETNNHVPADGLLVEGEDLEVDEVLKRKIDRDQNPFLFSGSKVKNGCGRMLVTSIGDNTAAMGKALSLLTHDPEEKTLLQARIEKTNDYIEFLALSVSVLIAFVMLIRLFCHRQNGSKDLPELKGKVSVDMVMKIFVRISLISQGKIWILTSSLTAMVIGIQHGMPFVITISLRYWKEKVEPSEADIHNLSACGTLGQVTVIYIEATGGLMCEGVTVDKIFVGEEDISNCKNSETGRFVHEALYQGLGLSVLAPEISVGPCTLALSLWLSSKAGLSTENLAQIFDILEYTKLSSVKKVGGVLMRRKDKEDQILHLHWNGAASTILRMCSHYYDSMGGSHAIHEDQLNKFKQMIKYMEDCGLRPIAFAHRQNENRELVEEGLNLLALVGLKYTCQEEARSAVEGLRKAGVRIKLVSEDEPPAVRAIACDLGIFRPGSNDVELRGEEAKEHGNIEKVELANVIGSCLPEDKLHMIQKLQQRGHIVAFFGGMTTSDALALKEANLGITMDGLSTELARQSSDVTLTSKRFDSLGTILKYGRCGYNNIQQFSQVQLTTCISGLLVALVTTTITGTSPITGLALFWVNWQMCLLGSQAMLMELKSQELLTNKPVIGPQSLITKVMWINIAIQVIYQASVFLIFQFKGQDIPNMNDDVRETMIFNAFFLCQIFNQFNAMDLGKKQVLSDVLHNWSFLVTLAAVMAMQVMVIELLRDATSFVRLNAVQWVSCFLVAALSWGFDLALKFLVNVFTKCLLFAVLFFVMFLFFAMPGLVDVVNRYDNIPSVCE